ncbi:cysteine hydrolase family protein [Rarobacter incanus]|uniref:Nicotinamidase-related amidase n=1 Tax=Rarobacter incanus TaxID=153494 RepID=A0A542SMY3_9MICO|nr:isochorismatase family cysteine hydrolase [Rarobacter incanus]TQK75984.1 nicotinamidase-related amidase [Rarobacter incanus]
MSHTQQRPDLGLVLIEFQNDFASPGGSLHDAVKEVMETTGMVDHAVAAAEAVRAAGGTVFHTPISFAEGYGELTKHPYGILKGVVDSSSFVKGTWGVEIIEELSPQPGDILIEGKRGLDAFWSTDLDFILRSKGITEIALAGFLTNCCVESTMRSAYEKGYKVVTLTDATAATSLAEQEAATSFTYPMFSNPMETADFIASLSGEKIADATRGY